MDRYRNLHSGHHQRGLEPPLPELQPLRPLMTRDTGYNRNDVASEWILVAPASPNQEPLIQGQAWVCLASHMSHHQLRRKLEKGVCGIFRFYGRVGSASWLGRVPTCRKVVLKPGGDLLPLKKRIKVLYDTLESSNREDRNDIYKVPPQYQALCLALLKPVISFNLI